MPIWGPNPTPIDSWRGFVNCKRRWPRSRTASRSNSSKNRRRCLSSWQDFGLHGRAVKRGQRRLRKPSPHAIGGRGSIRSPLWRLTSIAGLRRRRARRNARYSRRYRPSTQAYMLTICCGLSSGALSCGGTRMQSLWSSAPSIAVPIR